MFWNIRFTKRSDGNFALSSDGVSERRSAIVGPIPVVWLRQTHGTDVVILRTVDDAHEAIGASADAAITSTGGLALSVITADCAPLALIADSAAAVVHAGWKGLAAGIVETTVSIMRTLIGPAENITAHLGPCIHPGAYAFGNEDLEVLARRYGDVIRGKTHDGKPALDMLAGIRAACAAADVAVNVDQCADTADPTYFSHRVRKEPQRQALFVWRSEQSS